MYFISYSSTCIMCEGSISHRHLLSHDSVRAQSTSFISASTLAVIYFKLWSVSRNESRRHDSCHVSILTYWENMFPTEETKR